MCHSEGGGKVDETATHQDPRWRAKRTRQGGPTIVRARIRAHVGGGRGAKVEVGARSGKNSRINKSTLEIGKTTNAI